MSQAVFADAAVHADRGTLPAKDKVVIALIVFFSSVALTLEAYWLIFHNEMESRTDLLAWLLSIYWPADYTYRVPGYPIEKCFILVAETVNTLVTPVLSFLLIWGILKRKPWRYPLQLTIGTYTFYGTFLYYAIAHVSGYVVFAYKSPYTYLMFYLVNLPWFACYAWMAWDAFREIVKQNKRA
jgi:EXPERA (EXPanded EBP superfamily)